MDPLEVVKAQLVFVDILPSYVWRNVSVGA